MKEDATELSTSFVDRQRERLEAQRDQLLIDSRRAEVEQRGVGQREGSEVLDSGDVGSLEAQRDTADVLIAQDSSRLGEIHRALDKIAEGSYGLSDGSGARIPRDRLEAVPEACYTVEEEAQRKR